MSKKDKSEFISYLRICTDSQVFEVRNKESKAMRFDYALLAQEELDRRMK